VDICAKMIECIENDADVQSALSAYMVSQINDPSSDVWAAMSSALNVPVSPLGQPLDAARMATDLVGGTNPTCDKDILWAQCLAITREINRSVSDTLEKMEAASDGGELARYIASLPLINLITDNSGISAALDAADKALEFFTEGYIASYDATFERAWACALFCLCKEDCQITIERLFTSANEYVSQYGEFPVLGNLGEWITWFLGNVVFGDAIAGVMFYAVVSVLRVANTLFFGAGDFVLDLVVQDAADHPDDGWMLYCDDCAETWCKTVDWTVSDGGWVAITGGAGVQAEWASGIGWQHTSAVPGRITILAEFATPVHLTNLSIVRDVISDTGDTNTINVYSDLVGTVVATGSIEFSILNNWEIDVTVTQLAIDVVASADVHAAALACAMTRISLWGDGAIPVEIEDYDDCG